MTADEEQRWQLFLSDGSEESAEEIARAIHEAIHEMDEAEDSDTSQSAGPH